MKIELKVNGRLWPLDIDPAMRLLDVLRDVIGLTGAKEGCGEGECGGCTVLIDNKAYDSCLMLAAQAQGKEITTIEGLKQDGSYDPVQQAFIDELAVQCGYCTPGMIMAVKALLMENPDPDEDDIKSALAGNLCRCTGYRNIFKAAGRAVELSKERARG